MGNYVDINGNYYEGDRRGSDIEVVKRPSAYHVWVNGSWSLDTKRQTLDQLAALDTTYPITQRNLRDLVIILADTIKSIDPTKDLTQLKGYKTAKAVEALAAPLRELAK